MRPLGYEHAYRRYLILLIAVHLDAQVRLSPFDIVCAFVLWRMQAISKISDKRYARTKKENEMTAVHAHHPRSAGRTRDTVYL
eukprot:6205970-Pleurochrysis_carterae.AAC.3